MDRKIKYFYRVEYLIKDLDCTVQRKILFRLKEDFPDCLKKWVIRGNDDYENSYENDPGMQCLFLTKDIYINHINGYCQKFEEINAIMMEHNRKPLFPHPHLALESWNVRDRLIEILPEDVLNEEYNCTSFDDYVPETRREEDECVSELLFGQKTKGDLS